MLRVKFLTGILELPRRLRTIIPYTGTPSFRGVVLIRGAGSSGISGTSDDEMGALEDVEMKLELIRSRIIVERELRTQRDVEIVLDFVKSDKVFEAGLNRTSWPLPSFFDKQRCSEVADRLHILYPKYFGCLELFNIDSDNRILEYDPSNILS